MIRYLSATLMLLLVALAGPALAQQDNTARIGVLAYRGSDQVGQKWQGLKRYLDAEVEGWVFELVPITLSSAATEIDNGTLDFLLTNPGHFVYLNHDHMMSVIASRRQAKSDGSYASEFGSAVITRKDSGITLLQEVQGKTVAAIDRNAFGGFQLAWREFDNVGVDLFTDTAALNFVGFPMDQIIQQVMSGEADVGIVRSGLVEEFIREGLISPDDLVFLNTTVTYTHPDQTSTRLYPEWPFAAFNTTDDGLRDMTALALLSSDKGNRADETGMEVRWSAPLSYHAVEELAQAYRARQAAENSGPNIIWIILASLAAFVAFGLSLWIVFRPKDNKVGLSDEATPDAVANEVAITRREKEILDLISNGNSSKEIAQILGISPKTVEFHRANLLKKYGARTSSQLVSIAG
jgi:two-component system, LuxR family, sensor histidine kinase TtrS